VEVLRDLVVVDQGHAAAACIFPAAVDFHLTASAGTFPGSRGPRRCHQRLPVSTQPAETIPWKQRLSPPCCRGHRLLPVVPTQPAAGGLVETVWWQHCLRVVCPACVLSHCSMLQSSLRIAFNYC
jgi:hypothetical protein